MQETDWIQLKQTWLAMGPSRDIRNLQKHIAHKYRVKIPIDELRVEANKRNWTIDAIQHDSKLNQKIDAITVDSLAKELAAERINGWRTLRRQATEFSDLLSLMLPKVKRHIESAKVISIDDARKFMETAIRLREFMDNQEVPLLPSEDDAVEGIDYSNPAELGRALLNIADIRELNVTDLEGLKEPSYGGKS